MSIRAGGKSQVGQCWGFCSADSSENDDRKSAVQKPKLETTSGEYIIFHLFAEKETSKNVCDVV